MSVVIVVYNRLAVVNKDIYDNNNIFYLPNKIRINNRKKIEFVKIETESFR